MIITIISWIVLLFAVLPNVQASLCDGDETGKQLEIVGGYDFYSYWALTDENLVPLVDGDAVMVFWAGPDRAIDPPVLAQGSPYNGQPAGDDEIIAIAGQPYGFIEYASFCLSVSSWDVGDLDSLGHQRHPTPGEEIYVRIFNSNNLLTCTHYGESNLYEVIGFSGEIFLAQMPNDPIGPTTDTKIFGRFFKIIGGIDPITGQTFRLRDPYENLEDGDVVQLIYTGANGEADAPNPINRMPGEDDELIEQWGVGEGMYPSINTGVFRKFTASFDDPSHDLPAFGQRIFLRIFNADNVLAAGCYGDSPLYMVSYVIGESLNVFTDNAVDCNICWGRPYITIYGGWNSDDWSLYPMIDADGLRLNDGDLVQLIWAGPDTLIDELNGSTGLPSGDDSLLATWGIGEGFRDADSGCFIYWARTWASHVGGGYPARGDFIYLRVFNDSLCTGASYYGETETHKVIHEFAEEFYTFPDSTKDVFIPNPCYTSAEEWIHSTTTLPTEYMLLQNCPNPFNTMTEISFAIVTDGPVILRVYNILGAGISTLVNARMRAGMHTVYWDARDLASGVYFCRLQAGEFSKSIKMVLLK